MAKRTNRTLTGGFGITEIMVGIVISMLTVLVIMQSVLNFEGQKRTTTSRSDAQENGLIALHAVETDLRMAGLGLVSSGAMNCSQINYYNGSTTNAGTPGSGAGAAYTAQPVSIADGGSGPDTLVISYSNSPTAGSNSVLTKSMPSSSSVLTVNQVNGVQVNDLVLLSTPGSGQACSLLQVTALQTTANGQNVIHNSGLSNWNPPNSTNLFPTGGYTTQPQSYMFDMGSLVENQYQVLCGTLAVTGLTSTSGTPTCTGPGNLSNATALTTSVVSMKAQYGVAPAHSQSVTCWVSATNGGNPCDASNWASPSAANIARIKAVRVALVMRSSLLEKAVVTSPCTNVSGRTSNGPCVWPDTAANPAPVIDLSADPNWQHYRYVVWSTIVPLRNVLWANL